MFDDDATQADLWRWAKQLAKEKSYSTVEAAIKAAPQAVVAQPVDAIDAARYRWLRKQSLTIDRMRITPVRSDKLDKMIDAEIAQSPQAKAGDGNEQ